MESRQLKKMIKRSLSVEDSDMAVYTELYKKATHTASNVFLYVCIASFFILIAFFNYRISWKESEEQLFFNNSRDFWFSKGTNSSDTMVFELTLHGKYGTEHVGDIAADSYFLERFFEEKLLSSSSSPSDVNNDKRMFLDMDALGVHLYIQDMPVLGGFVVFLLFLWFIFARNNEFELFKKLCESYKAVKQKDLRKSMIDGVLYEKLFKKARNSSIKPYDGIISFFLSIARSLFIVIWGLLFVTFAVDCYETYFVGPDFQKYTYVSAKSKSKDSPKEFEMIPVFGKKCDYLIEKMNLQSEAKFFLREEVPLKEYLYAKVSRQEADDAMNKIYTMETLSAVFLFLIAVQIFLIHRLLDEEDKLREELIGLRDRLKKKTTLEPTLL